MAGTTGEGAGLAALAAISAGVLSVLGARAWPGSVRSMVPVPEPPPRRTGLARLRRRLPPRLGGGRERAMSAKLARRLNNSSALLALSVFADSSIEHYRGMFHNKAMFIPLAASAASLASSLHGIGEEAGEAHRLRHAVALTAAATGVVGGGFHLYNVTKREGGLNWLNLFYGAPLGAPYALILAGIIGTAAEHVRHSGHREPRVLGVPAGPALAAITSGGILGTVAEAALLHFRGAFHDPFMYLPVTIPPVAAGLIAKAGLEESPRWGRFTRIWFRLTALLGFLGAGFHIFGVARNMGGWRNWSQNVLNGPPIPAPPSFTGLALAGLAALDLLEEGK
jgi:hypothetical protein